MCVLFFMVWGFFKLCCSQCVKLRWVLSSNRKSWVSKYRRLSKPKLMFSKVALKKCNKFLEGSFSGFEGGKRKIILVPSILCNISIVSRKPISA